MNAPARKVDQYLQDLGNRLRPISEFELRRILRDCEQILKHASSQDAVDLFMAMAIASRRLGRNQESYGYVRRAAALEPQKMVHQVNLGVALTNVGNYADALDFFAKLIEQGVELTHIIWANTAECLVRLGMHDDAALAFHEALRVADTSDPSVLIDLAELSAILGADDDALELAARAIGHCINSSIADRDPMAVIEDAPMSIRQAIDENSALRGAIQRARVFAKIPRSSIAISVGFDTQVTEEQELANRDALAVFEATKDMRARANYVVLAEVENA